NTCKCTGARPTAPGRSQPRCSAATCPRRRVPDRPAGGQPGDLARGRRAAPNRAGMSVGSERNRPSRCLTGRLWNAMTLHSGRRFERDGVAIGSVDVEAVRTSRVAADVAESTAYWLDQALQRSDVYYFSIYSADKPIGQILLHDISSSGDTSLVAYHVFRPASRGKGIGTKALKLLQQ